MAKKKSAKKKTSKPVPKAPAKKKAAKSVAVKKPTAKKSVPQSEPPSLGRPQVTAEEKLFMLFKEDYHARQIFEYLRAETVRDLEQFSPDEIVKRLSQPIRQTVDRVRRKLAEKNRSLRDDQEFAIKHAREQAQ